jgi:hypothetical protein
MMNTVWTTNEKIPETNKFNFSLSHSHYDKGPSINYVVTVGGEGVAPKTIY